MNYYRFDDPALGVLNEIRFFDIYSRPRTLREGRPWLVSMERAPEEPNACGTDAVAVLRTRHRPGHLTRVPIQIKSSARAINDHLLQYPLHWWYRVVFAVVHSGKEDREIISRVNQELFDIWRFGWDYDAFWEHISSAGLSAGQRGALNGIRHERAGCR